MYLYPHEIESTSRDASPRPSSRRRDSFSAIPGFPTDDLSTSPPQRIATVEDDPVRSGDTLKINGSLVTRTTIFCEQCSEAFSRPENLARHVKAKHGVVVYICAECFRHFNRSDTLKRHRKALHQSGASSSSGVDRTTQSEQSRVEEPFRRGRKRPRPSSTPSIDAQPQTTYGSKETGDSPPSCLQSQPPDTALSTRSNASDSTSIVTPLLNSHEGKQAANPGQIPGPFVYLPSPVSWQSHHSPLSTQDSLTMTGIGQPSQIALDERLHGQQGSQGWDISMWDTFQVAPISDSLINTNQWIGGVQWDNMSSWIVDDPFAAESSLCSLTSDFWAGFGLDTDEGPRIPADGGDPGSAAQSMQCSSFSEGSLAFRSLDNQDWRREWEKYWVTKEKYVELNSAFNITSVSTSCLPKDLDTFNLWLSFFFQKFHHQLPVLHLPTFDSSRTSPYLLASIACIGGCFVEDQRTSKSPVIRLIEGIRRGLNKELIDGRNLTNIHAHLLVLIAGVFAGNRSTYEWAETFRGMLVNMCRSVSLLNSSGFAFYEYQTTAPSTLESRWAQWIDLEGRKRLGFAICFIDSLFPALFATPRYHSYSDVLGAILPCDERFWNAGSAQNWASMLGISKIPPSPFLHTECASEQNDGERADHRSRLAYLLFAQGEQESGLIQSPPEDSQLSALMTISTIHHHVFEYRNHLSVVLSAGMVTPPFVRGMSGQTPKHFGKRRSDLAQALELWSCRYGRLFNSKQSGGSLNRTMATAMYHLAHVSLNVSPSDLFNVTGTRGQISAAFVLPIIEEWVGSPDSLVAVHHSVEIIRLLSSTATAQDSVMYPMMVFVSVITMWAYLKDQPRTRSTNGPCEITPPLTPYPGPAYSDPITATESLRRFISTDLHFGTLGGDENAPDYSRLIVQYGIEVLRRAKAWQISTSLAVALTHLLEK